MNPKLRAFVDYGPLVAFFAGFYLSGKDMFVATGAVMITTFVVLAISYKIERKLAPVPLFTGCVVGFFGSLTLILKDPAFVMMKPTIIYSCFAALLIGGLTRNKMFLQMVMGKQLTLPDFAWRALTIRFAIFFILLAALNEFVRHNYSMEVWLNFKIFGATGLVFAFSISQTPYISKHFIENRSDDE